MKKKSASLPALKKTKLPAVPKLKAKVAKSRASRKLAKVGTIDDFMKERNNMS